MKPIVHVVGGGLAGSEAAWQLATHGCRVILHEMKPVRFSAAHKSDGLCELVCSNSFKSNIPTNPSGLLKDELRRAGSLVIACADKAAVPAGEALAVDRDILSSLVTEALTNHPDVTILRDEVTQLPTDAFVIVATGPLTSDALTDHLATLIGTDRFYFYDAISPIIEADSIDMNFAFRASRYDKATEASNEGGDYINCPLDKDQYTALREAILAAEKVTPKDFESAKFFEGCLPLEVLAERGEKTLAFGPFKPVGLTDPRTGRWPYAVIQLRPENRDLTAYSMVACQTRMTWPEQKRVFSLVPALHDAVYLRLGSIHRNTYLDAPRLLGNHWQIHDAPRIRFAGQILGVEGYLESCYAGFLAAIFTAADARNLTAITPPPPETAMGALYKFVREGAPGATRFDPVNIHAGLFPALDDPTIKGGRKRRDDRKAAVAARARPAFDLWWQTTRTALT